MRKKLAIKGHPTRGNEVIKLLEMMGGINDEGHIGTNTWKDEPIEIYTESQEKMVSLDKACEYLESELKHDLGYYGASDFADTFRKTMEK